MWNGKGSRARPLSVSKEKFNENWDNIFKKQNVKETPKEEIISNTHDPRASIDEPINK